MKEGNDGFIDSKIKELQSQIKRLEEIKNNNGKKLDKIQELLEYHAPGYQQNAPFRSDNQRYIFLKKMVIPELKKYGCTKSVEEIDQILLNLQINEGG